jgi:ankyrin repeat protein
LGHTPVSIAIELIDFQALELLEKNNVDLTYKDGFGRTYLMLASRVGFLPAVDLLIKNNLNINDMDNDGFTALSIAYRHKKELVVQYLLKNGAKTWVEKPYNPEKKYYIDDLNNRWK